MLAARLIAETTSNTALVRHAPTLNGPIQGSVQQLTAENTTFNGGGAITGDLLVPGTPAVRLNGTPVFGGTVDGAGAELPSNYTVTLNGGARLGRLVRRTDPVSLPTVAAPPAPAGTRSVALNNASQSPGDFATLKNLTLNSNVGSVAVPPGTYGNFIANSGGSFVLGTAGTLEPAVYNFQNLTLNGNSALTVLGPVVVTVDGGFSTNGNMGEQAHPDWLKLRIAGGGLSLNGNVSVCADLEAPDGTVTLNGSSHLIGMLAANRLTVNGNSTLQVLAPPANHSPVVTLTLPAEGTPFVAPATIALAATATDDDGTVTKVEFFNSQTKLGEDTTAPFEFTWIPVEEGTYELTAKATDDRGASTTSAAKIIVVAGNGLPFAANFESSEGYAAGPLNGQLGWTVTGSATIGTLLAFSGQQAVSVGPGAPPSIAARVFVNTDAKVTFADLYALPASSASPAEGVFFETDSVRVALTGTAPAGLLQAFAGDGNGGGAWVPTPAAPALDAGGAATDWMRLTVRSDYVAKKWDLYFNGRMVAADLGFISNAQTVFTGLGLDGHATLATNFDDLVVAYENPLFIDADHDGMDDAWEAAHGLNPTVDDRNADPDGDGLTNVQEYILGTDPGKADTDGDGLTDSEERVLGTNPTNADTDGDGLPDGWEKSHNLNPLSAADAALDSDGDGVSNLAEYQAGTDPNDYYNGVLPTLTSQVAADGTLGPGDTLSIKVTNAAGQPLANAPVECTAAAGGHKLSRTSDGPMADEVTATSDASGVVTVYIRAAGN